MIRKTMITLLAVAATGVLVLGVISFWRGIPDDALWISYLSAKPRFQAAIVHGTLHAVYSDPAARSAAKEFKLAGAGFELRRQQVGTTTATGIGVPFWFFALVLAGYPIVTCCRGPLRRRRRRARGLCTACGYNLTGLSEPRCPECGQPFNAGPD